MLPIYNQPMLVSFMHSPLRDTIHEIQLRYILLYIKLTKRYTKMRYLLLVISILSMAFMSFGDLDLKCKWKYIDYIWENSQQKQQAIDSGKYNPRTIFPFDVDVAPDGRVFIITMSDNKGVPVSLSTVSEEHGENGPLLRPYPNWSWYKDDCKGITGGNYHVDIKCNHLFLVDAGRIGQDQVCPAQLLIFDLSTDKLVKRVIIPSNIANGKDRTGWLTSIAIFASKCRDIKNNAIVFMTDARAGGLVVYNGRTSQLCRIESDFMRPTDTGFIFKNETMNETDGIFSLTLIRNELYYAAIPGSKIYKMEISKLLDDCSLSNNEVNGLTRLAGTLSDQTVSIASEECAIFFSDIYESAVMCADTSKEINSDNMMVIAQDSETLQFPSVLKSKQNELLIVSHKYHRQNTLNINETNFRVFSIDMPYLRKKTNCFASCSYKGK